jgi:hypothetical protein
LIREASAGIVVAPDDADGIQRALENLVARWRNGDLDDISLPPTIEKRISRHARAQELAQLLERIA